MPISSRGITRRQFVTGSVAAGLSAGFVFAGEASAPAVSSRGKLVPRPLYRDPPFDAPTDPVLCFNAEQGIWFMYYTARTGHGPGHSRA